MRENVPPWPSLAVMVMSDEPELARALSMKALFWGSLLRMLAVVITTGVLGVPEPFAGTLLIASRTDSPSVSLPKMVWLKSRWRGKLVVGGLTVSVTKNWV